MAHPNEELLRGGYEAFGKGDLDALRNDYFDEAIVWHQPGNNPLAGDFHGIDEVLRVFGRLFEISGGTFRTELHDVLANDEHAVALGRVTAYRGDQLLDQNYAHVCHIRNGKLTEAWILNADQAAADAFWA